MGLVTVASDQLLNGVASRLIYEGSPCDAYPCYNEGTCIENGTKSFTCECAPFFVGTNCEYRIHQLCLDNECKPGTSCDIGPLRILCPVKPIEDFLASCVETKCLNGGTCIEQAGSHRCSCIEPFHGPFCQFEGVDWGYDWTAIEIGIFLMVVFMIACAIGMICCSSQQSMGFYVSLPSKRYTRWEEGEAELSDEEEEDVFPLGELKKNLRVSRTTETMLEMDVAPSGSGQASSLRGSVHPPIVEL